MSVTKIPLTDQELFGGAGTPRVVVVGGGFGGIAMGVKLKKAGIDTFTIYESSLGVGGTWWDNTYPGAEVDVNSNLYCYSFKSHEWARSHAQQAELHKYLEEVVDEFGLRPHLQLGVTVTSAGWDDERHLWNVTLDSGPVDTCHALVSAVGFLNVPRYPAWPGLEEFEGRSFTRLDGNISTICPTKSLPLSAQALRLLRLCLPSNPSSKGSTCSSENPAGSCPRGTRTDRPGAPALLQALAPQARPCEVAIRNREELVGRLGVPTGLQAE